jgi:hypothetical protein
MKFLSCCAAALLVGNGPAFAEMGTPGIIADAGPELTAPVRPRLAAGTRAFSKAEAVASIEGEGYTDVAGLAKGEDGAWRGFARRHGFLVAITVDRRGNISTGL